MQQTTSYLIHSLKLGPMGNFIHIVQDTATNSAAIIDPAWDCEGLQRYAQEQHFTFTDILLTHTHYDHINAVQELLEQQDARLYLHKIEAEFWGEAPPAEILHQNSNRLMVGKTQIEALHTPGHTPGSVCYRLDRHLITGDTLFVFGCGRCDLPGGNPEQLFETLSQLRDEIPDDITILPGHDYGVSPTSTMAEQRAGNPFLLFDNKQDFVDYRMRIHELTRKSPYQPVSRDELTSCMEQYR